MAAELIPDFIGRLCQKVRFLMLRLMCGKGSFLTMRAIWRERPTYLSTNLNDSIWQLQSNLVISNSLISNYRLSRSENLVPVLTWNYDNR